MPVEDAELLSRIYEARFRDAQEYRDRVWKTLTSQFFQKLVPADGAVLDLGCGYGEFINNIQCAEKFGMDMNPSTRRMLRDNVRFLEQDCSERWDLPDQSLDTVFTSNFFEHLPSKEALQRTILQARRCLKPTGRLIALGPNIRCLKGAYWDFWDHHVPLTERSLAELLECSGFRICRNVARFLPYRMSGRRQAPVWTVSLYVAVPVFWRIAGKQFLVIAQPAER